MRVVFSERFNESRRPSFAFGYENYGKLSTYQLDFCRTNFGGVHDYKPIKPPDSGQVLPEKSPSTARYQYLSTTQRDICNFGEAIRRHEYQQCKKGFEEAKGYHAAKGVKNSLCHITLPSKLVTTYQVDFRNFNMQTAAEAGIQSEGGKTGQSAGVRNVLPTGDKNIQPVGERTVQPTDERKIQPARETIIQPAGDRTVPPTGKVDIQPAGERNRQPTGESAVGQSKGEGIVQPTGERTLQPVSITHQKNRIKTAPKAPVSTGMKNMVSEARRAYRWPSSKSVRLDRLCFRC